MQRSEFQDDRLFMVWSPTARRKLHPWRGMADPPKPARPNLKKIGPRLLEVRNILGEHRPSKDPALKNLAKAVEPRWADVAGPPHPDPEAEAAFAALMAINDYLWPRSEEIGSDLVSVWVAHHGVVYATSALCRSFALAGAQEGNTVRLVPNERQQYLNVAPWKVLRAHLAVAPEEDYRAARDAAEAFWLDAPFTLAGALAYAFPTEDDWVRSAFERAWQVHANAFPYQVWCVAASLNQPAQLERLADALVANPTALEFAAAYLPTALDRLGAEAAPALLRILKQAEKADHKRTLASALAAVRSPEVAAFFTGLLGDKVLGGQASEYLSRAPEALSQADTAAARTLLARLEPAPASGPSAATSEMPGVLADPPWLRPARKERALVVKGLSLLPYPETIHWQSGERTALLARQEDTFSEESEQYYLDHLAAGSCVFPERLFRLRDQGQALELFNTSPPKAWNPYSMRSESDDFPNRALAHYGLEAIPGMLANAPTAPELFHPALVRVESPRLAGFFSDCWIRMKKWKKLGAAWLSRFPEAALVGLMPTAVGPTGKSRQAAERTLRWVAARGHRELALEVAARYGAVEACRQVLDVDPLTDNLPSRVPVLPSWTQPASLPAPVLTSNGKPLPAQAVEHLVTMLTFSPLDDPYAGLEEVKQACTSESLERFAWELFLRWEQAGANQKESWAYQALGHLGGDLVARELTPRLRRWPGEGFSSRAAEGLEILGAIGTDVALMHLHGIAQKLRYKALQDKARQKIGCIAEARGLTAEELADRLVPDLDLDPDGSRTLSFGARQFRVGFDHQLRPLVRDEQGAPLKDLPKPVKADDPQLAAEAQAAWKALRKDAKALARFQLQRLELAMAKRRRWDAGTFRTFLLEHPLVGHLVRRLIWGAYGADGRLTACFRVAEDGTLATVSDEAFSLPEESLIGVAHPLETDLGAWSQVLADYQILQPFPQIQRAVFRAGSQGGRELAFEGLTATSGQVLGLEEKGWHREYVESGVLAELVWSTGLGRAVLTFDPGVYLPEPGLNPRQADFRLQLEGDIEPVEYSELVYSVEQLRDG